MTLNDSDSDGIVDVFATAAKTAITAQASLGGSAPDATSWETGDFVEDSDNAGSVWFIYDDSVSGGARRVDPGTGSNPITAETSSLTINGKEIFIQDTQPSSPSTDDIWIDTS